MDIELFAQQYGNKTVWLGSTNNGVQTLLTPVAAAYVLFRAKLVALGIAEYGTIDKQMSLVDGCPGIATFRLVGDEHVTGSFADMLAIKDIALEHGFQICALPATNSVPQSNQFAGETPSPTVEAFLQLLGIEVTDEIRERFREPVIA